MRRAAMMSVAVLALCGPARAFDFKADHFEALMLHTSERYGRGVWPKLQQCIDEQVGHSGICAYRLSAMVSLAVTNAIGTDRPDKVLVTWNGDPFGVGLLVDVVRGLGHVLSPTINDGSQDAMANQVLNLARERGSTLPETHWTIGTTLYSIRPNPHLGSRGDVLFTAVDMQPPNGRP